MAREHVDILAIGAHPDDVELVIGGTIAKMVDRGYSVAIVDMTRGEMGTRGTAEQRSEEARAAAEVLGVSHRMSLDLGDGRLVNDERSRRAVIEVIRRFQPKLVMSNYWEDLHPDHANTGLIVRDTMYPAGFTKFPADGEPYRPNEYLFYMGHFPFEPHMVVDVTDYWQHKVRAIGCYQSQLHDPANEEGLTLIGQADFMHRIESRARFYGSQIYRAFGEPFFVRRPVPVEDPVQLYAPFKKIFK